MSSTGPSNSFVAGTTDTDSELFKAQKSLFILGLIAFLVNAFWVFVGLADRYLNIGVFYRFRFVANIFVFITSILTLLFAFILSKNKNHKVALMILFIILCLLEIYHVFFMYPL